MYPQLEKELTTHQKRTPKSDASHKRNLKRIPLGVASNYRAYDPHPIFVKEAQGSHFRDLDGNDYIDHNLSFGAMIAGHCHPAVVHLSCSGEKSTVPAFSFQGTRTVCR